MMTDKELCQKALGAMQNAYAPYSGFTVGAALLCESGKVYTGCNVENAAFSASCCAERTAFQKAVSEGEKSFVKIAICGGRDGKTAKLCPPCGVCRQVMAEFCEGDAFHIVLYSDKEIETFSLSELLPLSFGKKKLCLDEESGVCK